MEACTEGHPTGSAGVATLDACLQGPCAEDCPAPVGVCDTGLTLGSEACDTCLGEACCDVLKTCLANETCEVCVTTGEAEGCGEEPLFGDVGACFTESCGDVCG